MLGVGLWHQELSVVEDELLVEFDGGREDDAVDVYAGGSVLVHADAGGYKPLN